MEMERGFKTPPSFEKTVRIYYYRVNYRRRLKRLRHPFLVWSVSERLTRSTPSLLLQQVTVLTIQQSVLYSYCILVVERSVVRRGDVLFFPPHTRELPPSRKQKVERQRGSIFMLLSTDTIR